MNKLLDTYNDVWSVNKYEIIIKTFTIRKGIFVKYLCDQSGCYNGSFIDEEKRGTNPDKFV